MNGPTKFVQKDKTIDGKTSTITPYTFWVQTTRHKFPRKTGSFSRFLDIEQRTLHCIRWSRRTRPLGYQERNKKREKKQ